MNSILPGVLAIMLALIGGGILGVLFFGSLLWTIQKGLHSNNIGVWFLGSYVVRFGLVLMGIFFITYGEWTRLVACFVGFIGGRILVIHLQRKTSVGDDIKNAP